MATNVKAMPLLSAHVTEEEAISPREEAQVRGLPSVGSARHGAGNCLPCAWFWKPQGCLNGNACLRCHLCPAGELKRRKGEQKAKRALAKSDVPAPEPELPSVGSRLHATGQCRPCAWFWKADGCRNGQSCGHCHLCPAGEAKARKQAKVAAIRAKSGESEAPAVMQVPVLSAPVLQAPVVYQAVLSPYPTLLNPWRNTSLCATNCVPHTTRSYPGLCYGTPEAGDRRTLQELCPAVQKEPLPSKGSALHAEGRCSPCAWFWKPQGCHHGTECGRCHLCPASEIKLRRKAKVLKDAKAEVNVSDTLILD